MRPYYRNHKTYSFFLLFSLGIIISIIIHCWIFKKISFSNFSIFTPETYDKIIPRHFHLNRVEIDPHLLEKKTHQESSSLQKPVSVELVEQSVPSIAGVSQKSLPGKPSVITISDERSANLRPALAGMTMAEHTSVPLPIALDPLKSSATSLTKVISFKGESSHQYSQLDDLMKSGQTVTSQTAPILLPTDLLFEYDSDTLKPEAEESLLELASLIQRNPKAEFVIEGFADSFGSEAYNIDLSKRRADSVKKWLVNKQGINNKQVKSNGRGKSHFIAPSNGTIQEQKLNRRVEIVIHG